MGFIFRIIALSFALILCSSVIAFGQSFENTSSVVFSGGLSIPTGDIGDDYGIGPFGRVTLRLRATQTVHIGLETGLTGPSSDVDGLELLQIPLRAIAIFPVAGEAASTPYLGVGGGMTINSEGAKLGDSEESNTEVHPTATVQLGYTLRPEAMSKTLFDFYIRYEQQFINHRSDYRNVDVGVGVGLCF